MVGFGGRGLTIYEQAANGDFKAVWDSGSQLEKVQFDNFPVSVHIIPVCRSSPYTDRPTTN